MMIYGIEFMDRVVKLGKGASELSLLPDLLPSISND